MAPYAVLSAEEVIQMKEDELTNSAIAKTDKRKQRAIDKRLNNYVLPRPVNPWNKTPELRIVLVGNVILTILSIQYDRNADVSIFNKGMQDVCDEHWK